VAAITAGCVTTSGSNQLSAIIDLRGSGFNDSELHVALKSRFADGLPAILVMKIFSQRPT